MEPAPPSARRPGRLPGARGRGRDPRPQGGGGAPPSAEPAPGSRRTIRVCVTLRIGLPSFSRYQWRESGLASLWPPCNWAWHATHGHLASAHVKRDRSAGRAPKRPRTRGRGKPWGVGWGGGTEGGAASVGTVLGGSAATPRSAAATGQSRGALSRMYAFISLAALHRRLLSGLSAPWYVAPLRSRTFLCPRLCRVPLVCEDRGGFLRGGQFQRVDGAGRLPQSHVELAVLVWP